jgi:hypothetical protein
LFFFISIIGPPKVDVAAASRFIAHALGPKSTGAQQLQQQQPRLQNQATNEQKKC